MAPFNAFVASLNFTHAPNFSLGLQQFIADRNIVLSFLQQNWTDLVAWLSQPQVFVCIAAWAVVFTAVLTLILGLGFGPAGVAAGSIAAAFQAWMYGGFTPAAGIFATLTSLGMVGWLMPSAVGLAACIATIAALVVWACGIGA